jgi:hypothetical protein
MGTSQLKEPFVVRSEIEFTDLLTGLRFSACCFARRCILRGRLKLAWYLLIGPQMLQLIVALGDCEEWLLFACRCNGDEANWRDADDFFVCWVAGDGRPGLYEYRLSARNIIALGFYIVMDECWDR